MVSLGSNTCTRISKGEGTDVFEVLVLYCTADEFKNTMDNSS